MMERLTGYENITEHCHNIPLVDLQLVFDRLAAYEDTGLTPEQVKAQQWISVKDGLPERPPDYFKEGHWWMVSDEDFIVADADGKVYEAHWTYGCSANNYFWYVNSLTPLKNITHWMPLPEPPKEAQK